MQSFNKIIISGGGTGGHIFPAIAIANQLKVKYPNIEILFIGALGKMEMEKVPQAGYPIKGLPIAGLQRKLTLSNFLLPFKLLKSLWMAFRIIKNFKPDAVVGVGGYASGPTLRMAVFLGIPTLIQEQNSYAGKTNKLLSKKVDVICTAYPSMEKFFPKSKIVLTGNPVRTEMVKISEKRQEAFNFFGLDPNKKVIFVMGGSLGARTLNESVLYSISRIEEKNIQILWQSGKYYYKSLLENKEIQQSKHIFLNEFIQKMDYAYAVADIIISRAGALSVSELCLVGKPCILVPSPNVAEDHQTKNALSLVNNQAAILIKDSEAKEKLFTSAFELMESHSMQKNMSENLLKMSFPHATENIVRQLEKIIK
ncbi:MAG: undecaprenyldiphospho-muramoylpentapeptide beta-N-acetylglucosaminyltransferase [Flavobacteriia bacterium]|nr:undecaprenyldiphospho-muramoylpentapeptide beta-N-acetylglucosaminyltransferase [Flavobacteriia bacterium]